MVMSKIICNKHEDGGGGNVQKKQNGGDSKVMCKIRGWR